MADNEKPTSVPGEDDIPRLELSGLPSRRARRQAEQAAQVAAANTSPPAAKGSTHTKNDSTGAGRTESQPNHSDWGGADPNQDQRTGDSQGTEPSSANTQAPTLPTWHEVMGRSQTEAAVADSSEDEGKMATTPKRNSSRRDRTRKTNAKGARDEGQVSIWAKIGMGLLFFILIGIILGTGAFLTAYAMIKVPEPGEFALSQKSTVYYADGETVMGTFAEIDRTIIDTSTIPQYVGQAVVSSEDRTFFTNSGIDFKGIARALINNLTTDTRQGGSTLSQQYVERYYLDTTTGYLGKAKEAILALKINREQSKDEILNNYLNTIYFGRGAYGIEEASLKYFGHPAKDLTLSESVMLAGIIPAPSAWDPAVDPDQAQSRWKRVLQFMVEDGYISSSDAAAVQFPEVIEEVENQSLSGTTGYLMQQIRTELAHRAGLKDEEIDSGGFKIISTIDKDAQTAAVNAVRALPEDHAPNLQVALSAINPANGEVVAAYGGADYLKRQNNAVTQDRAMAGSTFKPFGLLAYITEGGTIDDMYNGNSPLELGGADPATKAVINNFGDISYGYVTMQRATALSINTAYVEMNRETGPAKTKETAIKLGYPEDTPGLDDSVANVLGSASPHNLDITRAYATIASGGVRTDPHFVRSVSDEGGASIYEATVKSERVFSSEEISGILPALEAAAEWGSAEKASALGRPVGAKTGSSEDSRSAQFAGFIPQLAATVSMYQPGEDGSEETITPFGGEYSITGSTWPGSIWRDFMVEVTANMAVQDFEWYTPVNKASKFDTYTPPPPPVETTTPTVVPTQPSSPVPQPTEIQTQEPPENNGGEIERPTVEPTDRR